MLFSERFLKKTKHLRTDKTYKEVNPKKETLHWAMHRFLEMEDLYFYQMQEREFSLRNYDYADRLTV